MSCLPQRLSLTLMLVPQTFFRFRSQGSSHQPYDIAPKFNEKRRFDNTTVAVSNNQAYGNSLPRPCSEMQPPFPIYDVIPLKLVSSQMYSSDKPREDSEDFLNEVFQETHEV